MRLDLLVNDFCLKAFFDKKLEIYEGNFRRNFIHVKDVARCFAHCLENFDKVGNNVYNLGLDAANMTKRQLADKVAEHIPCKVVNAKGKDGDQRDYLVSSQKLYKTGFTPAHDLDQGIEELGRYFAALALHRRKKKLIEKMRNY